MGIRVQRENAKVDGYADRTVWLYVDGMEFVIILPLLAPMEDEVE